MQRLAFEVGRIYNRRQDIHREFSGQPQGGISTPREHPVIFLFTGASGKQYGYQDGWDEHGVFVYTGEGQRGDMRFDKGNKAIRDHATNGKDLLLFEKLNSRKGYRFLGVFTCANWEHREGLDVDGNLRLAIVFHLLPVEAAAEPAMTEAPTRAGIPLDQLRKAAYAAAESPRGSAGSGAQRHHYERSTAVRDYVLARAAGICEACGKPAPFKRPDGSAYLEPHHTRRLADGGPDDPRWVGATCPNCHRLIHYGAGGEELNKELEARLAQLESSG